MSIELLELLELLTLVCVAISAGPFRARPLPLHLSLRLQETEVRSYITV